LYIPLWLNFGINFYIIFMITRLLRQVLGSLPEDLCNAYKVRRHFRFITCQTLMFVFAGMICWSISTINRILEAFRDDNIPFEMNFFQGLLLPAQGIFNLFVYVAPVHLQKFCCDKGHCDEEKTVSTESYSSPDRANLEISEVEVSESDEDYDSDKRQSTNSKRSLTFQKFKKLHGSMNFYEGPGKLAVNVVRQQLSTTLSLPKL